MKQIIREQLQEILAPQEPPCLSLYQPTHRRHPENQQDPIRFKNLVKELEASLREKYPSREVKPLLEPFLELGENAAFWNHTLDGLGVLSAGGTFRVFQVPRTVPSLVVVAESFHTKPLIRFLQSADRYQVLCVSRDRARLYEGNRDGLDEVELAARAGEEIGRAMELEHSEPRSSVRSAGGASVHHGQGSKKDEVDSVTEKFFRAVDRAILECHSRPSGLPLLLMCLPEHIDPFRRISHNPFLLNEGVGIDPWSLPIEKLREEAWKKFEPAYLERLSKLADEFREAASKGHGTSDLSDIGQAVVAKRVKALLVEADREVAGQVDQETGRVEFGTLSDPKTDDLLDDLAEGVLRAGGEVVVVPAAQMPSRSGAAATYRF